MIFINIPSISTVQWHPFSLTSSSSADNDTISVISKCQGQWTNELYNMIDAAVTSDTDNMKHIPIAVEGPYGPSSIYYQRYADLSLEIVQLIPYFVPFHVHLGQWFLATDMTAYC